MEEKLKLLAERFQISLEEVLKKYSEYLDKGYDPEKALRWTDMSFKKALRAVRESAFFKGIVIGARELVDRYERMRQIALRMYNNPETRDQAIAEGRVTPDGIPLDHRKTLFGRDNPEYGKSIANKSLYERELFCILQTETGYVFKRLIAVGEKAIELRVPKLFTPLQFRASIKADRLGIFSLTHFEELTEQWDIPTVLTSGAIPYLQAHETEEYILNTELRKRMAIPAAIEGWIVTIGKANIKYIDITDLEMKDYIRCFIRGETVSIEELSEDDRVAVIGIPNLGRGGRGLVCSTYGLYKFQ